MIAYKLTLHSDTTTGTGLGGEVVNEYVARDGQGRPIISASHIKGLVRQTLRDVVAPLNLAPAIIDQLLGEGGWRSNLPEDSEQRQGDGGESIFRFTDCTCDATDVESPAVRLVTRTAIDPESRTIRSGSLRTSEAIVAGTSFHGRIYGSGNTLASNLVRLALLSLRAVGSGRTRGCGQCVVDLQDDESCPGELLRDILARLRQGEQVGPAHVDVSAAARTAAPQTGIVWFNLTFVAESPVLCPEFPEASNVLRSGFSIPASAVQGALLHRLDRIDSRCATGCFESEDFRAWPLHPVAAVGATDTSALPVRVALTHRVAKDIIDPSLDFADEAIDDPGLIYDRPAGSPLKAADGVLIPAGTGDVTLWRAADMPRVVSTHGVHNDRDMRGGRNLYTVEAMGPLVWRGILACPADAAAILQESINHDPGVAFGKARSVRGIGRLTLSRLDPSKLLSASSGSGGLLIAQSPIALPGTPSRATTQGELKALADEWARHSGLGQVETVWAAAGLQFGWNRHRAGRARQNGRAPAARVILPGAVIRLDRPADPAELLRALLRGIGEQRQRGFGALLPHPGKARSLFREAPQPPVLRSANAFAIKRAYDFFKGPGGIPSASQISSILARIAHSPETARTYLADLTKRGQYRYAKWSDAVPEFQEWLAGPADQAAISLQVLRDLVVANERK